MDALKTYYLTDVFSYLMVLARLGALIFFMPGFADESFPMRLKMLLTLALTVCLTPILPMAFPAMPQEPISFFFMLAVEAAIGYMGALTARLLFSALDLAGSIFSFQMGLSNAFATSPATAQQSAMPGIFYTMVATLFLILSDLHHIMLHSFVQSYHFFAPGFTLEMSRLSSDFFQLVLEGVKTSFILGVKIASPIMVIGLLFFLAAGIVNRLIPQIQVFFVTQPLQILLGLSVMCMTLFAAIQCFHVTFLETFRNLWFL